MNGVQYFQKGEGAQRADKPGAILGVISEAEIIKIIETERVAQELFYKSRVTGERRGTPHSNVAAVKEIYIPLIINL